MWTGPQQSSGRDRTLFWTRGAEAGMGETGWTEKNLRGKIKRDLLTDWIWWLREEITTKSILGFLPGASGQTLAPFTKTGVPEEGQDGGSRL